MTKPRLACHACRLVFEPEAAAERRSPGLHAAILHCPRCDGGDLMLFRLHTQADAWATTTHIKVTP